MKFFKKIWHLKINPNCFVYLILVVSLFVTVYAWDMTRKQVNKEIQVKFENQTNLIINILEKRIDLYVNSLYNLQGFFAGNTNVDRKGWTDFITAPNILERYPGILSFYYAEKVTKANKNAFEKLMQNDKSINTKGYPDYKIYPETDKNEYYPIKYLEPQTANRELALGFDISSEDNRRTAMEKSRDLNKAVATNKIISITSNKPAFVIYVPIYDNNKKITTFSDRVSALKGFVAGSFSPNQFFPVAIQNSPVVENINLEIFDSSDPDNLSDQTLIFQYDQRKVNFDRNQAPRFTGIKYINAAENKWIVRFTALPEFKLSEPTDFLPLIVLISGIDLSFLLFVVLFLITRTHTRALKIAEDLAKDYRQHDKLHSHTRVDKFTIPNKKD